MSHSLTARLSAILLALGFFASQALADEVLPVLQTKTEAYEKVTVISRTKTHVFIQHSQGVANIKLTALDAQALTALGFSSTDEAVVAANASDPAVAQAKSANRLSEFAASLSNSLKSMAAGLAPNAQLPNLSRPARYGILGGFAATYLFFCYCSMLICNRTANKPGVLVWLPVVQVLPLLRAAGMSRWWFMTVFAFILLPFAYIFWCVKIARACGKSTMMAILLILPVTNIFAYVYLAFSGGAGASKDDFTGLKPDQVEPLPA